MILNMRALKFQFDPQKFDDLLLMKFLWIVMRLKESEENDDDIDYDQVHSLVNSKLLLDKIIQVICSIF